MSDTDPRDRHVREYIEYAVWSSDPRFRAHLADVYEHAAAFIGGELGGRQCLPFIRFGPTPPRSLCHLGELTGHGASWEITINEGLAVELEPRWVLAPLPSPGTRRFVHGLLRRQLVRQCVWEVDGAAEGSYGGYGPRFCAIANSIGLARKWRQVIPRRRGPEDANELLGKAWPHCCELELDAACYGGDVTQAAIDLALGGASSWRGPRTAAAVPPVLGAWELVLHLLAEGRVDQVRRIAATQVDRLRAMRKGGLPVLPRFELGQEDEDGSPISHPVEFDPAWLVWNGGTVRTLAESIHEFRDYALMPVLADALQEAGCDDGYVLRHLNSRTKGHGPRCWVLRGLLAPSGGA